MGHSQGTPCSTQLIFCETQKEKLEEEIVRLRQELTVLREAAKNVVAVKGRYHTEIAYKFLEALVRDTL